MLLTVLGILWLALLLAFTFALYGLIRKLASLGALVGFTLEALLLTPLAIGYLLWGYHQKSLIFAELSSLQLSVLLGAGVVTALPLIGFAIGAKQIPMSLLGMLHIFRQPYNSWLVFGEPLSLERLVGYLLVWFGVLFFLLGMKRQFRT